MGTPLPEPTKSAATAALPLLVPAVPAVSAASTVPAAPAVPAVSAVPAEAVPVALPPATVASRPRPPTNARGDGTNRSSSCLHGRLCDTDAECGLFGGATLVCVRPSPGGCTAGRCRGMAVGKTGCVPPGTCTRECPV